MREYVVWKNGVYIGSVYCNRIETKNYEEDKMVAFIGKSGEIVATMWDVEVDGPRA